LLGLWSVDQAINADGLLPIVGGDKGGIAKTQLLFQAVCSLLIEEKRSNYKSNNSLHPKNFQKPHCPLPILNCKKVDAGSKNASPHIT
jgi:hypothetical protein